MAAATTDKFLSVGTPGSATTLASDYTIGDTTVNPVTTTNFPTDSLCIFSIDVVETDAEGNEVRVEGSYCAFEGIITSATSIGSVTKLFGDDQNYTAGATTRVYITISTEHNKKLMEGLLVSHDRDGSLKDSIVTTAKIDDGAVTPAKIENNAVTPAKRSGGFYIGTISATTMNTTGNKAITGVGFTPKLVRFVTQDANSTSAVSRGEGAMTSSAQYAYSYNQDSSNRARRTVTNACVQVVGATGTVAQSANYVSMDADGFTINVTTAFAQGIIFEAYA